MPTPNLPPNAGSLDRRITIQSRTTSPDPKTRQPIDTWSDLATVWAKRVPVHGWEAFKAHQVSARIEVHWDIRYRPGIDPTMRILHEGKVYDILSVEEIGRRQGLRITSFAKDDE